MPMDTTDEMYQKESTPEKPDKDGDKEESTQDSVLVPLAVFGPKKPKVEDECKFKVIHIYEDEAEMQYVKKKDKDKDDDSDDDDDDKPRKHHHHRHDDDEDFLSDRKVAMMGIGMPGAGP